MRNGVGHLLQLEQPAKLAGAGQAARARRRRSLAARASRMLGGSSLMGASQGRNRQAVPRTDVCQLVRAGRAFVHQEPHALPALGTPRLQDHGNEVLQLQDAGGHSENLHRSRLLQRLFQQGAAGGEKLNRHAFHQDVLSLGLIPPLAERAVQRSQGQETAAAGSTTKTSKSKVARGFTSTPDGIPAQDAHALQFVQYRQRCSHPIAPASRYGTSGGVAPVAGAPSGLPSGAAWPRTRSRGLPR